MLGHALRLTWIWQFTDIETGQGQAAACNTPPKTLAGAVWDGGCALRGHVSTGKLLSKQVLHHKSTFCLLPSFPHTCAVGPINVAPTGRIQISSLFTFPTSCSQSILGPGGGRLHSPNLAFYHLRHPKTGAGRCDVQPDNGISLLPPLLFDTGNMKTTWCSHAPVPLSVDLLTVF